MVLKSKILRMLVVYTLYTLMKSYYQEKHFMFGDTFKQRIQLRMEGRLALKVLKDKLIPEDGLRCIMIIMIMEVKNL